MVFEDVIFPEAEMEFVEFVSINVSEDVLPRDVTSCRLSISVPFKCGGLYGF